MNNRPDSNNLDNIQKMIDIKLTSNCLNIDLGSTFTYSINIENKSNINLYNLNIVQKLYKFLRISDVIIDSENISTYNKGLKFLNFYIDELKYNEKKTIDIVVELINYEKENFITSCVEVNCNYIDISSSDESILINSNTVEIAIVKPTILLKKSCSAVEAIVSDILTFDLIVENKGNVFLENVIIRDLLSPELNFISDSIYIDGKWKANTNVISGINVGSLKESESKSIQFKCKIIESPISGVIKSSALGQYQYSLTNEVKSREGAFKSNEVSVDIQTANLDIIKSVNISEISLGDTIDFSIEVLNTGTLNLKNVFLQEILDNSLILIDRGYSINNIKLNNLDLVQGIYLGNIDIGERKILNFSIKYTQSSNKDVISCKSIINYDYQQTAGLVFKGLKKESILELKTTLSNFKYISISENLYKTYDTPNILEVDNVIADTTNLNYHVIKTFVGKSTDGQILTGNKVIIQEMINLTVEYTSDDKNNSVYTFNSSIPFSTFIVLPHNYDMGSKINISSKIDYINFKKKDSDCIYLNLSILLVAKIHSYDY